MLFMLFMTFMYCTVKPKTNFYNIDNKVAEYDGNGNDIQ